jgi:hypothetical protein
MFTGSMADKVTRVTMAQKRVIDHRHSQSALEPREYDSSHCTGCWMGPRAVLESCEKLIHTQIQCKDRLARIHSLYILRYPAHSLIMD